MTALTNPIIVQKRPLSAAWAVAAVFVTVFLVVGVPMAYVVMSWSHAATTAPGRLLNTLSQAAADAVRPKVTIHEIVLNSISDLHKENKLVVYTADVSTDITREEGSVSWGMYWGTNVARVAVKDARVQYVIDLNTVTTSDFLYTPEAKVLSLSLPRPHIDTTMVAIDPARIQTLDLRGGWGRWDVQDTRDHALAELRPQVIAQANARYVHELANTQGLDAVTQFLQPLADTISRDGIKLHVSYRD
jgi:hypothetical protein